MNREEARSYILEHAKDYLKPDKSGKGYMCPICGSGGGAHGTGITENPKSRGHFTCWAGCFENADILDIIGVKYCIDDYNGRLQRACEEFGIFIDTPESRPSVQPKSNAVSTAQTSVTDTTSFVPSQEFFQRANTNLRQTNYRRGISLDTLNKFCVGYVEQWKHPSVTKEVPYSPRLIIPNDDGGYLARDTRANLTEIQAKYSKQKVSPTGLFNSAALSQSTEPVYIVEAELDALSIIDAGGQAMALCSTANAKKLLEVIKEKLSTQPLIISLDNDEAGSAGLSELNISSYRYEIPKGFKDANEFFMSDREAFRKWVRIGKTPVSERESVAFRLNDFLETVRRNREGVAIPTGFDNLDNILDGGLYPSLICLGANSSVGKTTLVLEIADNVARAGYGVLVFSLEMSSTELIAKSLSRQSLILDMELYGTTNHALTTRKILRGVYNDTEKELLRKAIEEYSQWGKNISITEGVGNVGVKEITAKVQEYMQTHEGRPPVVVVDYLQLLAPFDIRMTDKQSTDKSVLELKRLSRDFQIPVIGISSFNRESYSAPVSMASFKESGAIEYSSDVLIGLQYAGWDYAEKEKDSERKYRLDTIRNQIEQTVENGGPIEIQVKILKHRNGRRTKKGGLKFEFFPRFNYFRAQGEYQQ